MEDPDIFLERKVTSSKGAWWFYLPKVTRFLLEEELSKWLLLNDAKWKIVEDSTLGMRMKKHVQRSLQHVHVSRRVCWVFILFGPCIWYVSSRNLWWCSTRRCLHPNDMYPNVVFASETSFSLKKSLLVEMSLPLLFFRSFPRDGNPRWNETHGKRVDS